MSKKLNSVSNELFNVLFDRYWKWLLNEFNSLEEGEQIYYSPLNGNTRYVESVDYEVMKLREVTERAYPGNVSKNELRKDFYKLCHDPEINIRDSQNRIKRTKELYDRYKIKNLREFKRNMFEEFEKFSEKCLNSSPIYIEMEDLTDEQIDEEIKLDRLLFGCIAAGDQLALQRQRRGQDRLHKLTLKNYDLQCAVCDVADPKLLIASHIVRWADSPELRGKLSNIICLCRMHDALFEQGYWSLKDDFSILIRAKLDSHTVELILNDSMQFRKPKQYLPEIYFLQRHRSRCQLN